jgi:hypothetical protein
MVPRQQDEYRLWQLPWQNHISSSCEEPRSTCPTSHQVLVVHEALCAQVSQRLTNFDESERIRAETEISTRMYFEDQIHHFRLQPLFRAIVMVVEDCGNSVENCRVHLIKTGRVDGLSEPISFESIRHKAHGPFNKDVVTTDFETALDFLIALERKEVNAGCASVDAFELDKGLGDAQERAERLGYTSGPIAGPSTLWTTDDFIRGPLDLSEWVERKEIPRTRRNGLPSVLNFLQSF